MSPHRLARDDAAQALRRALREDPALLDAYDRHPDFQRLIYRHGLKGTPLHVAAFHNSLAAARALLELGADPNKPILQFERGYDAVPDTTPLDLARRLELADMVALLEKRCQTPFLRDSSSVINILSVKKGV